MSMEWNRVERHFLDFEMFEVVVMSDNASNCCVQSFQKKLYIQFVTVVLYCFNNYSYILSFTLLDLAGHLTSGISGLFVYEWEVLC